MRAIPVARSTAYLPLASFLGSLGLDAGARLEARGVPPEILELPDAVLPEVPFWGILADLESVLPDAGYRLGASHRVVDLPNLAPLVGNRSTLMATMKAFGSLLNSHNNYWSVWIEPTATGVRLCRRGAPLEPGRRVAEQYAIGYLVDLVRMAASPSWWPGEIWLSLPGELHREELRQLGDAKIHTGSPVTAISIPIELLGKATRPIRIDLDSAAEGVALSREVSTALRSVVLGYLRVQRADLATLGRALGCHPRTLQRQLAREGTSLQKVVDRARFELAAQRLSASEQPITDLAFDLGYEEATSFTRAFRRWTGVSPRAYREANRAPLIQ